ncbi:MAG: amidohydrolase [Gammaproteobacteria bacterium]|nr:amidohydrolase [Gammaproteobacteria bacterium]
MTRPVLFALLMLGGTASLAADQPPRASIDLIVAGDYVVTMDDAATVIEAGSVAIDDGRIVAVGKAADVDARYAARTRLPGDGRVVMPGLINGHTHAAMTLLRGIADDLALESWLKDYVFPAEVTFVDEAFVRIGTELACWEMIRGGTTTFVDMYYFPATAARAVESCGLRAIITAPVLDQQTPDARNAADALERGRRFIEAWQGRSERIVPAWGPHSNYTLNLEQLGRVRDAALASGTRISIHLLESPFEVAHSKERYGDTTVQLLERMQFFTVPTIGAHVVWPSPDEIDILARRSVGAIYNPTSNMKTAAGIAPVTDMLAAGVNVGIGTDGAASNNDLDMWEEMRLAALLQKVARMDPEVLPASVVLRMATAGGAAAIGLADRIGRLVPGLAADVIQVAVDDMHFIPTYDLISHLVYVADEQDVAAVVVDGRVLLLDGEFPTLDIERIRRESRELGQRIRARLPALNADQQQQAP